MAYPEYDTQDLADFSGRPKASYRSYAATALSQARLLFKLATCLKELPEDSDMAELAKMAILAMADDIVLKQQYQKVISSPFSSESIGSYSYSKRAQQVQEGDKTGIMWFDLAVSNMGVCDINSDVPMSGGIEIFEHDGVFVQGQGNNTRMLAPSELEESRRFGYDPAPRGY